MSVSHASEHCPGQPQKLATRRPGPGGWAALAPGRGPRGDDALPGPRCAGSSVGRRGQSPAGFYRDRVQATALEVFVMDKHATTRRPHAAAFDIAEVAPTAYVPRASRMLVVRWRRRRPVRKFMVAVWVGLQVGRGVRGRTHGAKALHRSSHPPRTRSKAKASNVPHAATRLPCMCG